MFHEILAWNESQEFRRETPHPPKRNKLIREVLVHQSVCSIDHQSFLPVRPAVKPFFEIKPIVLWRTSQPVHYPIVWSFSSSPMRVVADALVLFVKHLKLIEKLPVCLKMEHWRCPGLPDYQNSNFGVPPLLSQTLVLKLGHNVKCVWKHR